MQWTALLERDADNSSDRPVATLIIVLCFTLSRTRGAIGTRARSAGGPLVDVGNEAIDPAGVVEVAECFAVDLFGLQRFHEPFGPGVVERIAGSAHADGDVAIGQYFAIGNGRILHATIGVVDQAAARRHYGDSVQNCHRTDPGTVQVVKESTTRRTRCTTLP